MKTREKPRKKNWVAYQKFFFSYIQTEMPIVYPRSIIDKQVAGYLSLKLGGRADQFGSCCGGAGILQSHLRVRAAPSLPSGQ